MENLGLLDSLVALAFTLIVFVAGLSFARLAARDGAQSFFSGGGIVPWWVSGLSLYMSFFSVGTFVVWGSIAYSDGLVAVSIQTTMCIAGLLIGWFIAQRWNRSNALTAAEYLGDRFGRSTKTVYTALFLVTSIIGLGSYLYPVGRIIEVATGLPFSIALIGLALFILIYTAVGGLWAVLVTDVLQFVVLTAAIVIVVPLAFAEIGGVSALLEQAPERFFELSNSEYTPSFLFAFLIYNTIFIGGHWAYVQRYTSVESPRAARKVAWLFSALYIFSPLIWMLPPMIYRVMQPDLAGRENEAAYMLVSMKVLPTGLLGLMLTAMVFATASSVNTILNITAGVFTNDVYGEIRKDASERETVNVARLSTAAFGLVALGSAFMVGTFGGIVEMVLSIAAIFGGSLFLPPLWSLFSRRQTAFSILFTTLVTITTNFLANFLMPRVIDFSLDRTSQMVLGVAFPILILLAFELFYAWRGRDDPAFARYEEIRAHRSAARAQLIERTRERDTGSMVNFVIGLSVVMVGLVVLALAIASGEDWVPVATVGGLITLVGLALIPQVGGRLAGTSK